MSYRLLLLKSLPEPSDRIFLDTEISLKFLAFLPYCGYFWKDAQILLATVSGRLRTMLGSLLESLVVIQYGICEQCSINAC